MSSWEELERKYSGGTSAPASDADPWAALEQKYSQPAAAPAVSLGAKPAAKEERDVSMLDRVRAGMAGINKGFYSDLLGLPVDTIANVIDLAKAGYGTAVTAAGRVDLAPTVNSDRSSVVGSADWIAKKINQGGMGAAINNPNPQDPLSRIAYTGGRVGGASVVPAPNVPIGPLQQVRNIGGGLLAGTASGAVAEVAPEWAPLAGMTVQAAPAVVAGAMKLGVRGGEAGRQKMDQRLQDFKNAGVESPSVGLASGKKSIQGMENILSQTPGSVGVFERSKQKMIDGMQARAGEIRDNVSKVYGPAEAGAAIQSDLKGAFKERIGKTYGLLNDRVEQAVGNSIVPVSETLKSATSLSTPIRGAEATSAQLINPRIAQIAENLRTDVYGAPRVNSGSPIIGNPTANLPKVPAVGSPSVMNQPAGPFVANPSLWNAPAMPTAPMPTRRGSVPMDRTGIPNAGIWNAQKEPGIPFPALKSLRTRVGKETQSNAIMGTPEQAEFKQLYGAMSQDMKNAVAMSDTQKGVSPAAPGSATTALNRANDYYSKAMGRVDDLNQLSNRSTPEGAYNSVANSLQAGSTVWKRLRGAVTPEARQKVVATVIDDLGRATPGQQGADGNLWSARTFLTNYNRIDPETRGELFKRLPGGKVHAENLADIAKAAEMIGDSSKIWANPSGTGAALTARGTFGAIGVGAFFEPMLAATTAGGLVATNGVSRLLLSPIFVNWLAKAPKVAPGKMQSYAQRLVVNAKMSGDAQLQQDVAEYLASVEQSIKEQGGADGE